MDITYRQVTTLAEARTWLARVNGEPKHFAVIKEDPRTFQRKVKARRVLAADFCHTLTVEGQWDVIRRSILTTEQTAQNKRNLDVYFARHKEREAPKKAQARFEHQLVYYQVTCMRNNGTTRKQLWELGIAIGSRAGARELLESFNRAVVVSFGIADIIEPHLAHNGVRADVLAARLIFDAQGRVRTVQEGSIVVGAQKDEALHHWLSVRQLPEESTVVVGDDPMVDGRMFGAKSLNVLVRRGDGKMSDDHLAQSHFERIHAIVSDLEVLAHLRKAT